MTCDNLGTEVDEQQKNEWTPEEAWTSGCLRKGQKA